MSYTRPVTYVPGNTLVACAVCDMPTLFPQDAIYASNKRFYCLRTCWLGETEEEHHARRAAWRPPVEQPFMLPGKRPGWR